MPTIPSTLATTALNMITTLNMMAPAIAIRTKYDDLSHHGVLLGNRA